MQCFLIIAVLYFNLVPHTREKIVTAWYLYCKYLEKDAKFTSKFTVILSN